MRALRLLSVSLGATLLSAGTAGAWQSTPHSALLWSYPDGYTWYVPANAVFRAFGYRGAHADSDRPIVMELDGREVPSSAAALEIEGSWPDEQIEFQRRFQHPVESTEFVPPELLSTGKHQVVFKMMGWDPESGAYATVASYQFTIHAEGIAPNPVIADVAISAVTGYTANIGAGPVPPVAALDGVCESLARLQHDNTYGGYLAGPPRADLIDSGPATRVEISPVMQFAARVDIAAQGPVLGYLIGSQFVRAGCTAIVDNGIALEWQEHSNQPSAVSFYAQAVLETGVGAPHGFTGEVPIVGPRDPPAYVPYLEAQTTSGSCSLGAVDTRTSSCGFAALALLFTSAALRRSRLLRRR